MKSCLSLWVLALSLFTLGATVFAASSVASPQPSVDVCIATCPDGYQYPKCTKEGYDINYFADPCMFHSSASSAQVEE